MKSTWKVTTLVALVLASAAAAASGLSVLSTDVAYYCQNQKNEKFVHFYSSDGRFYVYAFRGDLGTPSERGTLAEVGSWNAKSESADYDRLSLDADATYTYQEVDGWEFPVSGKRSQMYAASMSQRLERFYIMSIQGGEWKEDIRCVQAPGKTALIRANLTEMDAKRVAARKLRAEQPVRARRSSTGEPSQAAYKKAAVTLGHLGIRRNLNSSNQSCSIVIGKTLSTAAKLMMDGEAMQQQGRADTADLLFQNAANLANVGQRQADNLGCR